MSASVRKKGYLHKLPVKGVVKKWSRKWFVLHATTHEGVMRVEYFDEEDHEASGLGKRTIPLRGAHGIVQSAGSKTRPFVFEFSSQIGYHMFATESSQDVEEWLSTIKEVMNEDSQRKRRKSSQGSMLSAIGSELSQSLEDSSAAKVAWDSSNSGVYRVTLEFNETTEKLNLKGNYNLEITPAAIALVSAGTGAQIAIWPYRHVKSYGKSAGRVTIETGKVAEVGSGKFVFVSTCCREIFGIINRNIRRLRDEREKARLVKETQQVEEALAGVKKTREARGSKRTALHESSTKHVTTQSKPRPRPSKTASYSHTHQGVPTGTSGTYRSSRNLEDAEIDTPDSPSAPHKRYSGDYTPHRPAPAVPPQRGGRNTSAQSSSGRATFSTAARMDTSAAPTTPQSSMGQQPPPPGEVDFTSTDNLLANLEASIAALGRTSYTSRDSRDSAIVGQFPEGSFDNPLAYDDIHGIANPLGVMTEEELDFQITDIDDELLDTVDEMELQDSVRGLPPANYMSPTTGQMATNPLPSASRPHYRTERRMSQQELDVMWDEISSNLPDSSAFS